jgi:hypothetical protein
MSVFLKTDSTCLRPLSAVTNNPERLAFIAASRKRARKALYWLNVYAQNGLRNSIDTHVLIEIARHAHAYDTNQVKAVTRQ